jgi:hypothetical protein
MTARSLMPTISSESDPLPIDETLWVFEATGDCGTLDGSEDWFGQKHGVLARPVSSDELTIGRLVAGGDENLLEDVEFLDALSGPDGNAAQRVARRDDQDARFLLQAGAQPLE